jgi:oligoendopeptidase F
MLAEVTWDLSDLLERDGAAPRGAAESEVVGALLDRAEELAAQVAKRHEGRVAELDGPGLREAMERLAEIGDLTGRAMSVAHLRFAADTADPEVGALLQMATERATAIRTTYSTVNTATVTYSTTCRASRTFGDRSIPPPRGRTPDAAR